MDIKSQFAKNLRKFRISVGLTQEKLAQKLSYTGKAVSKWETGATLPPAELLPALARILDTDLNSLFQSTETPAYFLGIDGGGTKTDFLLTDASGAQIRSLSLGGSNPVSVGMEATLQVLRKGIAEICGALPTERISLFAGIAGCGVGQNRDTVLRVLEKYHFCRTGVGNDADNIISAGLQGRDGIIAILGTGSVVFSVSRNTRHQVGGYGHSLGDSLSGSELGRICVKAALRHLDGSGPATQMTREVTQKLGLHIPTALSTLYSGGKALLASFAPVLFDACAARDPVACAALERNTVEFADQICAALSHQRDTGNQIPVVLAGGITHFAPLFLPQLMERIAVHPQAVVEILDKPPTVGAVILAGGTWKC